MGNVTFDFDADALEKAIRDGAIEIAADTEYDYSCPSCGADMKIKVGETRSCPSCGFEVTAKWE